jgi:hypothetical protein
VIAISWRARSVCGLHTVRGLTPSLPSRMASIGRAWWNHTARPAADAGGSPRRSTRSSREVGRERVDPLRAGVVEGGLELHQGGLELLAFLGAVLDRLLTFLLRLETRVSCSRRLRSLARARSRSRVARPT